MIPDPFPPPDGRPDEATVAAGGPGDIARYPWSRRSEYAAAVLAARHAFERWRAAGAMPSLGPHGHALRSAGGRLSAIGGPAAMTFAMYALYPEGDPRQGEAVAILGRAWREFW